MTFPGIIDKPFVPLFSSLKSNNNCNPKQIPKKGLDSNDNLISSINEFDSRAVIHDPIAP